MTPVILLPGMMCTGRLFAPQISALSGKFPIMTIPISTQACMTDLAFEVLRHAPPKFAIAGLSMGGIVAMEVARVAPERVAAICLMDTNHLAEKDIIKARRNLQRKTVESGGLADVLREDMKPNYLAAGERRQETLDLCMEMALELGPAVFERQSVALMNRRDQTETLRSLSVPALVLCGEEDRLCPVERHEMMHELIVHSELQIIENAGHLPTLEQPQKTTQALARWLEAL